MLITIVMIEVEGKQRIKYQMEGGYEQIRVKDILSKVIDKQ